ncbi:MAG: type II secretory pathway predicted ATPase ExeA [Gammaproteobacteria bacterium]|jgi:type II secretory pathway predicted ATPase ExeA
MYNQHFELADAPFSITPDPRFLYLSPNHREALAHLSYVLRGNNGFVMLTGEVGTGKTTLCRTLIGQLPDNVDVALILNPQVSAAELLATICDELGVTYANGESSLKNLTDALNEHLLSTFRAQRSTLLLVDEAQNLGRDLLEQIRMLTNLETTRQKLLQIVLVGQPELRDLVARPDLRQLSQRITARYHLDRLTSKETRNYIEHRLSISNVQKPIFTAAAMALVHRSAKGIPRSINMICDRALLGAFATGQRRINKKIASKAASEVLPLSPRNSKTLPVASAVVILLGAIWLTLSATGHGSAMLAIAERISMNLELYVSRLKPDAAAGTSIASPPTPSGPDTSGAKLPTTPQRPVTTTAAAALEQAPLTSTVGEHASNSADADQESAASPITALAAPRDAMSSPVAASNTHQSSAVTQRSDAQRVAVALPPKPAQPQLEAHNSVSIDTTLEQATTSREQLAAARTPDLSLVVAAPSLSAATSNSASMRPEAQPRADSPSSEMDSQQQAPPATQGSVATASVIAGPSSIVAAAESTLPSQPASVTDAALAPAQQISSAAGPQPTGVRPNSAPAAVSAAALIAPSTPTTVHNVTAPRQREPAISQTLESAFHILFKRWGVDLDSLPGFSPCDRARPAKLKCLNGKGGWKTLQRYDRPAIVKLRSHAGKFSYAVVRGVGSSSVLFENGSDGVVAMNIGDITALWTGEFVLLWAPPAGLATTVFSPGMRNQQIGRLRDLFAEALGHYVQPTEELLFDKKLGVQVREFQRTHGLRIDGIVGAQTLIRLNSVNRSVQVPRLAILTALPGSK